MAEDMSRIGRVDLANAAERIAVVWRGEAANAYLSHCATTREHIRSAANDLLSEANSLESLGRQLDDIAKSNAT